MVDETRRPVRVTSYAGHRADVEPRCVDLGAGPVRVRAVVDRWRTPHAEGFVVLLEDGNLWRLVHDPAADTWEAVWLRRTH